MSRIGNKSVAVPSGVTANVEGQTVKVKGPKGAVQVVLHDDVTITLDKGAITIAPRGEGKRARSMWGTSSRCCPTMCTSCTSSRRIRGLSIPRRRDCRRPRSTKART